MIYTGIIVTCPGNIIVDKIITKVIWRPFQFKRDRTYAGGTLETTVPIVPSSETNKVFKVHFKNGTAVKIVM